MKTTRWMALLLALCMVAGILAGCGASSDSFKSAEAMAPMMNAAGGAFVQETAAAVDRISSAEEGGVSELPENRKFIITVRMDVETEELDALLEGLNEQLTELSGYIQSQNIQNGSTYAARRYRSASLTVRIPAQRLAEFTRQVETLSNVVSSSRDTEDVTLSYVDTQSRVTALEVERDRLMELLVQAENMSDLLEIESRLTEVRYQLEQYASQLRVLDNQIDYATVYLSIDEVREYTPVAERSRWEKICDGFMESLKDLGNGILDFFGWILIHIPYLVVWGVMILVIVLVCRRMHRRRKEAKQKRFAAQYQAMQARQNPEKQDGQPEQ